MRLGGGIVKSYSNPEEWIKIVKELRYSAVVAPMKHDDPGGFS